jgi:hypothetical protein
VIVNNLSEEDLKKYREAFNASPNPVRYLSIDPGKANGICGYDGRYSLLFMFTIQADEIVKFLDQLKCIDICVVEDYMLYPNKAMSQIYSTMETSRIIGRIESWTTPNNIVLVKQPAKIKPTGYKWIGQKPLPKSNQFNHEMDAHVHFMYWAILTGRVKIEEIMKKPAL